jgi:hypothetical protein
VADGFGVDLVDLEISGRPESELRRFFSEDGYHPPDAGYAALAGVLLGSCAGADSSASPARRKPRLTGRFVRIVT